MPYRDTWATCEKCGKQFVFTVEEQRRLTDLGFEVVPPPLCPGCQKEADLAEGPHEGIVKWYDPERGYGFIIQRSGSEIFFHRSGIAEDGAYSIPSGVRVTYLVEQTDKGPQAVEVALMEEQE